VSNHFNEMVWISHYEVEKEPILFTRDRSDTHHLLLPIFAKLSC